jgi:L-fuculose-phosphate aldolase
VARHQHIREDIIATCRRMNAAGLNVGTAGNVSVRVDGGLLITPTGVPYDAMRPDEIAEMDDAGRYYGEFVPSSEWRFHYDILKARPDVDVVLHCHAIHCAILACCRLDILPLHYMVASAGGKIIKCSEYAPFGTAELSAAALKALGPRMACLLGNHGVITLGATLGSAFALLEEVENLARIAIGARALGGGVLLTDAEMDVVLERFKTYGQQAQNLDPNIKERVEPPPYGGPSRR